MFTSYRLISTPRDNYLAALANVRAAEAEYLAAERLQQEEDAIRYHLRQIQAIKQPLWRNVPYDEPAVYPQAPSFHSRSPQLDIEALRRQIAFEERQRILEEQEQEQRQREVQRQSEFQGRRALSHMHPRPTSSPNPCLSEGLWQSQIDDNTHNPLPSIDTRNPIRFVRPQFEHQPSNTRPPTAQSSQPLRKFETIIPSRNLPTEPVRMFIRVANHTPANTQSEPSKASSPSSEVKAPESQEKPVGPVDSRSSSVAEIEAVLAAFNALSKEWATPGKLDFSSSRTNSPAARGTGLNDNDTIISRLSSNAQNQPLRQYHQTLSKLLARLDAVESFGDEDIRHARKAAVGKVEGALDEVESMVETQWRIFSGRKAREDPVLGEEMSGLAIVVPPSAPAVSVDLEEPENQQQNSAALDVEFITAADGIESQSSLLDTDFTSEGGDERPEPQGASATEIVTPISTEPPSLEQTTHIVQTYEVEPASPSPILDVSNIPLFDTEPSLQSTEDHEESDWSEVDA
ncbi:BAG domain-containing protein [Mycena indigotica]|uniref:BAG domain-containing protein n=1 Tax=Mycena indigotica TaxID=2126181 RepID=A0A8H6SM62_9AGAR|nr:BAG domain-containing protein [Mycena indigotica]KAF7301956.1 BAG domain-containing protein [Mycena indigotica]